MLDWVRRIVAWLVILGLTAILVIAVVIPRIAGATPYTVLTGSMRPTLPPGTLVVVRPVDADDLGIGDVVTYQLESGRPAVVTHRIVGLGSTLKGERTFITRGDANDVADAAPVRTVQIRGEVWYSAPYLGYANNVLTGRQRQLAVYTLAGFLLAYATYMFTGSITDRRHSRSRKAVSP